MFHTHTLTLEAQQLSSEILSNLTPAAMTILVSDLDFSA
jgi:hypothetical protein